jgi:signal transduction histidine kinase
MNDDGLNEHRLRAELERALRGLEATTEIARALGGETDLDRVLETISKRARTLVEARSLIILLEERGELEVAATAGELERDSRGWRLPIEGSMPGRVLRSLEPERVADVGSRLRISPGDLGVDATAAMLVPLSFSGGAVGVILAFDRLRGGPEFRVEDEWLMASFAASAASAVATAQMVAQDRRLGSIEASERERGRWARELHDETLQGLGGLRVVLSSALRSRSTETLEAAARQAVSQLGGEIESLRSLIAELRPAALDHLGLATALEGLARGGPAREPEVEPHLDLAFERGEAAERLEPELENTIYRIVQEALTNVAKHARAERVRLRVVERGGAVEIAVQDDGVGFEPGTARAGFGIVGMRERVTMAGGRLEVSPAPGGGTLIWAVMPATHRGSERADAPAYGSIRPRSSA